MKKKAIKIAASTAVAASAFVAAAPVNKADAAVNVEQLVKDAENAAGALKWAISVEGTADGKTAPHGLYNLTKDAKKAAEAAVAKTSGSEKVLYLARLQAVELQISRTMAYIDGITAGDKITAGTDALKAAVAAKDLDAVEKEYHALTKEVRKQAELLYRVYGQTTRALILDQNKKPAEEAVKASQIDVTVKMHLDAAVAATKAGDLKLAGESYAKAMDWMDKVSSTFKAELTKNGEDVLEALPLRPVSVTQVNNTTLTVNFSKEIDVAAATHFTFDNKLFVSSVEINADKKSVTLTTGKQEEGKTYKLSYKGEETGVSFTVPKTPTKPDYNADVDSKDVSRQDSGTSRAFVFTLKNDDNSLFKGEAAITLYDKDGNELTTEDVEIASINGSTTGIASDGYSWTGRTNDEGKINIVIEQTDDETAASVYAKVTFESKNGTKSNTSGVTYFYAPADSALYTGLEVGYLTKEDDYFVAKVTGVDTKFKFDKGDIFQVEGNVVTFDKFKEALSQYDEIDITNYVVNGQSKFNIVVDHKTTVIAVDQPTKSSLRLNKDYYRLQGVGEAGYTVYVYSNDSVTTGNKGNTVDASDTYVTKATVNSNGTWAVDVNLDQDELNDFVVVQYPTGVALPENGSIVGKAVALEEGAFIFDSLVFNDASDDDKLGTNDTVAFRFGTTWKDLANIPSGAELVFSDISGKKVTYVVGKGNTTAKKGSTANLYTITLGTPTKVDAGFDHASTITVTSFDGVTNQDNMKLEIDESLRKSFLVN